MVVFSLCYGLYVLQGNLHINNVAVVSGNRATPELLCLSVFTFGSGFMLTIGCKKEILFWGGDVKVVFTAKLVLSLQTHT